MITIQLDLNPEQLAALETLHHGYELNTNTVEEFLADILLERINAQAKTAYDASVARLGSAAASLPYEARLALIAQVEAQLS